MEKGWISLNPPLTLDEWQTYTSCISAPSTSHLPKRCVQTFNSTKKYHHRQWWFYFIEIVLYPFAYHRLHGSLNDAPFEQPTEPTFVCWATAGQKSVSKIHHNGSYHGLPPSTSLQHGHPPSWHLHPRECPTTTTPSVSLTALKVSRSTLALELTSVYNSPHPT